MLQQKVKNYWRSLMLQQVNKRSLNHEIIFPRVLFEP
jgi:hypothetical protein